LKKINKNDRPLANLTEMRREKTQISKIRNRKEEITTNTKESSGTLRAYIQVNWKIWKKQTNFQIHMII
jgi:hypothetical protein